MDVEFLTQYLILRHAHDCPDILGHDTRGALAALVAAGRLDRDRGRRLIDAWTLWQGLQDLLALTIEGELTEDRVAEISNALAQDLARVGGVADFARLEDKIRDTLDDVHAIFKAVIEEPAALLPPAETTEGSIR